MIEVETIKTAYKQRYQTCQEIADIIKDDLQGLLENYERIDKISVRAKNPERFVEKALRLDDNGNRKYTDPINQVQDQIGARVVTFYLYDIDPVTERIKKFYKHIEEKKIVPDSYKKFSYEGRHLILFIPESKIPDELLSRDHPYFFEMQINTLFQHAWAEAEHELGYKVSSILDHLDKRYLAFTAAQAWGADRIFDEVFRKTKH